MTDHDGEELLSPTRTAADVDNTAAGVRASYVISPTLVIGGEALGGYEQRAGAAAGNQAESLVFGTVGMPVAEAATPDIWVYTDITLGIAIPLEKSATAPFFGINEI